MTRRRESRFSAALSRKEDFIPDLKALQWHPNSVDEATRHFVIKCEEDHTPKQGFINVLKDLVAEKKAVQKQTRKSGVEKHSTRRYAHLFLVCV